VTKTSINEKDKSLQQWLSSCIVRNQNRCDGFSKFSGNGLSTRKEVRRGQQRCLPYTEKFMWQNAVLMAFIRSGETQDQFL